MSKPVLVGIVGDVCSGKSSFAQSLADAVGAQRASVVRVDDYRKFTRAERLKEGFSRVHPDVYYQDIIAQQFELLHAGQPVLKPVYHRGRGEFDRPQYVETADFVFVEGLFAFATPAQRDALDLKIFLEPDEALRRNWYIQREVGSRRRDEAEVVAEISHWQPDVEAFIAPQQKWADLVIQLTGSVKTESLGLAPAVKMLMRPSLPRPSLAEFFAAADELGGIRLGLARDLGLPVDRIEIDAGVPNLAYSKFKKMIMDQVLKSDLTVSESALGNIVHTHQSVTTQKPMALAQWVVLYQMAGLAAGHL